MYLRQQIVGVAVLDAHVAQNDIERFVVDFRNRFISGSAVSTTYPSYSRRSLKLFRKLRSPSTTKMPNINNWIKNLLYLANWRKNH